MTTVTDTSVPPAALSDVSLAPNPVDVPLPAVGADEETAAPEKASHLRKPSGSSVEVERRRKDAKSEEDKHDQNFREFPAVVFWCMVSWRMMTFLWVNLGIWGPYCGNTSVWDLPATSDVNATRAFGLMAWFAAIPQFVLCIMLIADEEKRKSRMLEWVNLALDAVICLFTLIAFACLNGCGGYGLEFERTAFSFSLIMCAFGIFFVVPGLFRFQFIKFARDFQCGQQDGCGSCCKGGSAGAVPGQPATTAGAAAAAATSVGAAASEEENI